MGAVDTVKRAWVQWRRPWDEGSALDLLKRVLFRDERREQAPLIGLDVLRVDHEVIFALLGQLLGQRGEDAALQEGLFAQLKYELETHTDLEEEIFYPALEGDERGSALVNAAAVDHEVMLELLDEVEGALGAGQGFLDRLEALKRQVERHVREEEEGIFPLARAVLGPVRLRDMGLALERHRKLVFEKTPETPERTGTDLTCSLPGRPGSEQV